MGGNNAHCLALAHSAAPGQVQPIALLTDAKARFAGKRAAHKGVGHCIAAQCTERRIVQHCALFQDRLAGFRVGHLCRQDTRSHPLQEGFAQSLRLAGTHPNTRVCATVQFGHDHILGHVHQTPGQITRIRGAQRGVGQTLARAVRAQEVFQSGQPLAEVGADGQGDDPTVRVGHQTAHTGQLAHGIHTALCGAGAGHRAQPLHGAEQLAHGFGHLIRGPRPQFNGLLVKFFLCDQTPAVLALGFTDIGGRPFQNGLFGGWHFDVAHGNRNTRLGGVEEAYIFDIVHNLCRDRLAQMLVAELHHIAHALFV